MATILRMAEENADFGLLWEGLKEYKALGFGSKNGGRGSKSNKTPEAVAAKCLRASLKFIFKSLKKAQENNV